ncbi:MAG: helix-turn-helix transcriptional regulator [Nitratireductor sp.]|nr:helix-turn-helix transcriptional regulator [Nitratireductor sp.]
MLSHDRIWAAIDALASSHSLSASGLARKAGLDPTSFNKSKRFTGEGRPRWPSTESVAKALRATGTSLGDFLGMVEDRKPDVTEITSRYAMMPSRNVPLLGFAEAGTGGFFDDGGFPVGQGWDEVQFPGPEGDTIYALEVSGTSMEPLYRDGDIIIVQPDANVRKRDRVVVRTHEGEVMAKELVRKTATQIELKSLNPEHEDRVIAMQDVEWVARIVWASQ